MIGFFAVLAGGAEEVVAAERLADEDGGMEPVGVMAENGA